MTVALYNHLTQKDAGVESGFDHRHSGLDSGVHRNLSSNNQLQQERHNDEEPPKNNHQLTNNVHIMGIDIDSKLIERARKSNPFPDLITFHTADVMLDSDRKNIVQTYLADHDLKKFDLVTCFSVTLWIHLHHGDEGLGNFLKFVCEISHNLLIEPQPYKCYKTAARRMKRADCEPFPHFETLSWRQNVDDKIIQFIQDDCDMQLIEIFGSTKWDRKLCLFKSHSEGPASDTEHTELNSSQLGTQEYWKEAYERELQGFSENGDIGEVWFGFDSMERVIHWIENCDSVTHESSILDIGCGNGVMLTELAKLGYQNLTGIDYVQKAIDLARCISQKEGSDEQIRFEVTDILEDPMDSYSFHKHDVCLDKGTYDAISLSPESPKEKRLRYQRNVYKLMTNGGLFIITSCNWTEAELTAHFEAESFRLLEKIPSPSFQFGGQVGNRETSVIFTKD